MVVNVFRKTDVVMFHCNWFAELVVFGSVVSVVLTELVLILYWLLAVSQWYSVSYCIEFTLSI